MKRRLVTRRQVLIGTGGFTLGLPFLPSLLAGPAYAQQATFIRQPRFFTLATQHGGVKESAMFPDDAVLTASEDIYAGHTIRHGALVRTASGGRASVAGILSGADDVLTDALVAKMNVLRGIDIPFYIAHHTGGYLGNESRNDANAGDLGMPPMPTIDQLMAWSPSFYQNLDSVKMRSVITGSRGRISYMWSNASERTGSIDEVRRSDNAKDLFNAVFVPDDPTEPTAPPRPLIVDRVIESYRSLRQSNRRLGAADRQRLDDHLDRLAELQRRLNAKPVQSASCGALSEPTSGSDYRSQMVALVDVVVAAFLCGTSRISVMGLDESRFVADNADWHQSVAHQYFTDAAQAKLQEANQKSFEYLFLDLAKKLERRGGARRDRARRFAPDVEPGERLRDAPVALHSDRHVRRRRGQAQDRQLHRLPEPEQPRHRQLLGRRPRPHGATLRAVARDDPAGDGRSPERMARRAGQRDDGLRFQHEVGHRRRAEPRRCARHVRSHVRRRRHRERERVPAAARGVTRRARACFAALFALVGCGSERAAPLEPCGGACLSREEATWPMPNPGTLPLPNPARVEVSSATARDAVTGLVWARENGELVTASDADAACETLTLEGEDDYRLPTRIELVSLLDRTVRPTLDGVAFPGTPLDYFWTSSSVPGIPGARYSVYFGAGETSSGSEDAPSAYARCVRGGSRRGAPRFRNDATSVLDLGTGLEWQRAASESALSLAAARALCTGLEPGENPFRLPSDKELETLVDTTTGGGPPLIDAAAFPETPPTTFWTLVVDPIPPLVVDFATGFASVADASGTHRVRCVR